MLFVLALLPAALYLVFRLLGMMSLARLGLMAVVGIAGSVLIISRPKIGAFFVVFYIYAGLRFYLPAFVSVAVTGLTAAAVLLEMLQRDQFRVTDRTFWIATTVFVLLCVQSVLWAHDYGQTLATLGVLFKTVLLTVIIAYVVKTPGDLRELGKWIFFGGVATVSLGAVNTVLGLTPGATVLGGAKLMRFSGTQLNPNYAAALMLSVLPLGVFYLKHAPKLFLKVIGIAGIVVLIAGVFATLSRAAIFAFAVVIFGVLLREVRSRKTGVAIILLFVIGILFSPRYYWVRVTAITDISNSIVNDWSFYMRYVALLGAWEAFLDHPFFGVGLRNFSTSLGSGSIIPIGPHNMYVGLLAELGITGLAMYLVIQFSAFRHMVSGFRAQWPENYSWLNDLSYYLALGVIAALISGVFMDCEYSYVVWIPVGAGIALGCLRQEFGNRPAGERS